MLADPEGVSAQAQPIIRDLLIALTATKQFLAFQYASWCIRGPSVEANIALAGIAQEELGHAMAIGALLGTDAKPALPAKDALVTWKDWGQPSGPAGPMIESWPEMIVTCIAHDAAATATLEALRSVSYLRLAQRIAKMLQEEKFHLTFGIETARTFAGFTPATRDRLAADYRRALAAAEAELNAGEALSRLADLGLIGAPAGAARVAYRDDVSRRLAAAWA